MNFCYEPETGTCPPLCLPGDWTSHTWLARLLFHDQPFCLLGPQQALRLQPNNDPMINLVAMPEKITPEIISDEDACC